MLDVIYFDMYFSDRVTTAIEPSVWWLRPRLFLEFWKKFQLPDAGNEPWHEMAGVDPLHQLTQWHDDRDLDRVTPPHLPSRSYSSLSHHVTCVHDSPQTLHHPPCGDAICADSSVKSFLHHHGTGLHISSGRSNSSHSDRWWLGPDCKTGSNRPHQSLSLVRGCTVDHAESVAAETVPSQLTTTFPVLGIVASGVSTAPASTQRLKHALGHSDTQSRPMIAGSSDCSLFVINWVLTTT